MKHIYTAALNKERLKKTEQFINQHKDREYNLKVLHHKLEEEINIEFARLSDRAENKYLNNLTLTMEKAQEYLKASKKYKGDAFNNFCYHFHRDIREALDS